MSMFWEHDRASVGTNPASLPYLTLPNQLPTLPPLGGGLKFGGARVYGRGGQLFGHPMPPRLPWEVRGNYVP